MKFEIPKETSEMYGYGKLLSQLLKFIEIETDFNPSKRYIDSVKILDMISVASAEIKKELEIKEDVLLSKKLDIEYGAEEAEKFDKWADREAEKESKSVSNY